MSLKTRINKLEKVMIKPTPPNILVSFVSSSNYPESNTYIFYNISEGTTLKMNHEQYLLWKKDRREEMDD